MVNREIILPQHHVFRDNSGQTMFSKGGSTIIAPSSKDQAIHQANDYLLQVIPTATNVNVISVLETEDSYRVFYPLIVPGKRYGKDCTVEIFLPKSAAAIEDGQSRVFIHGVSDAELSEIVKIPEEQTATGN